MSAKKAADQPEADQQGPSTSEAPGRVTRFARLMALLDQKLDQIREMERQVQALQKGRIMAVDGESSLLTEYQTLVQDARAAISNFGADDQDSDADAVLNQLDALLNDVQWDVADIMIQRLDDKSKKQEETLLSAKERLVAQRKLVTSLQSAVDDATIAQAPVRSFRQGRDRLMAQLDAADRAYREQLYDEMLRVLVQLEKDTVDVDERVKAVRELTERAERYSRQADLLLLQSPLDVRGRFQYAVLLRTPSEPGSHGINVQDSSTLVRQDRDQMSKAIDRITAAIERGLARQGDATPAVNVEGADAAALAAPTPSTAAPPRDTATVRAVSRRVVFGDDTPSADSQLVDLSGLVREMGAFMYRLFMPEQMQKYIDETSCSLTVTTNDLELPWEFMYYEPDVASDQNTMLADDEKCFLCLNRPVARMPMGRSFPIGQAVVLRRNPKLRFLLIYSDPENNLPGARREIELIEQGLKAQWGDQLEITVLRGPEVTGQRLNQILVAERYDVIHYSGHAYFDAEDPDLSGLLLHDREIFFAQKIRRLLEGRPLVFLNACESARTANENSSQRIFSFNLQKPAEGLASSFVYGGALGCIGSLWPIYDQPAARFAIEFYNQVLEGHMIGEAMRAARRTIKIEFKDRTTAEQITWAAFVLYGDPTFRLVE